MKHYISVLLFTCLLAPATVSAQTQSYPTPSEARWENRILVLCDLPDGAEGTAFYETMVNRLDGTGAKDRDLFLVHAQQKPMLNFWVPTETAPHIAALTDPASHDAYVKLAGCSADVTDLSLAGKDGGVKQRWISAPAASAIFNVIDAMPMRMREMGRWK